MTMVQILEHAPGQGDHQIRTVNIITYISNFQFTTKLPQGFKGPGNSLHIQDSLCKEPTR